MKIRKNYDLPFPPARVYDAWTSSETVIPPATGMDINPVVGGHYRLIVDAPEQIMFNEGTFSVVEPGERLKYTWEWNGDGAVTEIEVLFAEGEEGTSLHLTHSGFASSESMAMHDTGWDSYVEGLKAHLEEA